MEACPTANDSEEMCYSEDLNPVGPDCSFINGRCEVKFYNCRGDEELCSGSPTICKWDDTKGKCEAVGISKDTFFFLSKFDISSIYLNVQNQCSI